jgi:hypothetical protein
VENLKLQRHVFDGTLSCISWALATHPCATW